MKLDKLKLLNTIRNSRFYLCKKNKNSKVAFTYYL